MGDGRHEGDRLSAFLDDELSDEDALVVARHLDRCDRCLQELAHIRTAREALRSLPSLRPPAAALDVAVAARRHAGERRFAAAMAAVAVALGVFAGTVYYLGGGSDGTVVPPVEVFVADHVARADGPVPVPVELDATGR